MSYFPLSESISSISLLQSSHLWLKCSSVYITIYNTIKDHFYINSKSKISDWSSKIHNFHLFLWNFVPLLNTRKGVTSTQLLDTDLSKIFAVRTTFRELTNWSAVGASLWSPACLIVLNKFSIQSWFNLQVKRNWYP